MQVSKNEITSSKEKVETRIPKKSEEQNSHIQIRCVNCSRIVAEVEEILMGKMVTKCNHCGTKNRIDRESSLAGRGKHI